MPIVKIVGRDVSRKLRAVRRNLDMDGPMEGCMSLVRSV